MTIYSDFSYCKGVGKSTLLRHIALREVPVPSHITILFVEQEVRSSMPYDVLFVSQKICEDYRRRHNSYRFSTES